MAKKTLYLNGDSWTSIFYQSDVVKEILYKKYNEVICDAKGGACNKDIWISTKNSINNFLDKDTVDVCIFLSETLRGEKEFKIFQFLCHKYGTSNGINFICKKLLELYKTEIEKELIKFKFNYEISTAFINCPWKPKIPPMYKVIVDSLHMKENLECYSVSNRTVIWNLSQFNNLNFTEKQKYEFVLAAMDRIELLDTIGNPYYDLHLHNEQYLALIAHRILKEL